MNNYIPGLCHTGTRFHPWYYFIVILFFRFVSESDIPSPVHSNTDMEGAVAEVIYFYLISHTFTFSWAMNIVRNCYMCQTCTGTCTCMFYVVYDSTLLYIYVIQSSSIDDLSFAQNCNCSELYIYSNVHCTRLGLHWDFRLAVGLELGILLGLGLN